MSTYSSILAWRIPMDRGAWGDTVHRVTQSQTQLKRLRTHAHTRLNEGFLEESFAHLELIWSTFSSVREICFSRASQAALAVKKLPANAGDIRDAGLIPGLGRSPGGGCGNPLQCSCLEDPHGQRSLVGYSPWGHKELDTTE